MNYFPVLFSLVHTQNHCLCPICSEAVLEGIRQRSRKRSERPPRQPRIPVTHAQSFVLYESYAPIVDAEGLEAFRLVLGHSAPSDGGIRCPFWATPWTIEGGEAFLGDLTPKVRLSLSLSG